MSEWREFADRDALDQQLAEHIASRLRSDITKRGAASLAVSGGGTPRRMFQLLSACPLDWSRVWVTLVDERWVNPDNADSNERLVREELLVNEAATARFVSLKSAHDNAEEGLQEIAGRLSDLPRPLSVLVLGMGGDGHTASWFPQAANLSALLDPGGSATVAASDPVTAPHQRMTLTLPTVVDSREIIIHITGQDKRTVLEDATRARYPIAAILEQTSTPATTWWAP